MIELDKVEVVMEGGSCGPELQVVVMEDGPFYYADEVDKCIKALEAERDRLREALKVAMPILDDQICYASTRYEHQPNDVAATCREALEQK